jgi:hypothetical protein
VETKLDEIMTLEQIKKAVDDGFRVVAGPYEVIKDSIGQYLIHCLLNDHYVGLHGQEGTKHEHVTNLPLSDFVIEPA